MSNTITYSRTNQDAPIMGSQITNTGSSLTNTGSSLTNTGGAQPQPIGSYIPPSGGNAQPIASNTAESKLQEVTQELSQLPVYQNTTY